MDEVVCLNMPLAQGDAATNETANIPPLRPGAEGDLVPSYNSNIVSLQSYPGSAAVLLLDFFGGYTPTWGGVAWSRPNVSNDQIKDLWKRVAEDYMSFNINVTTDLKVYQNAPTASKQRCVFTPATTAIGPGAAGVAYIGSWNWGSDTVCWSIYTSGKNGSEVGAHEPGHTLGLGHQGTSTSGYSSGQGSGVTGWGPIMGAGYYQPVTTWAHGEYQDANNQEDELNIITTQNNSVHSRPDDTGNALATSRYLELYPDGAAFAEGVIETTGDTDAFQFTTTGGQLVLTAKPLPDWADLAVSATLADATDTVISSNNPQTTLSATINTVVPAGTYTFRVTGAGRNSPLTNGFSAYSSLGYYSIAGFVTGGKLPTRLNVFERVPVGTTVGNVPAIQPGDDHAYSILSGNSNSTFAVDNTGIITVANNTLLDYNRMATNSMLAVQFELQLSIADLSDPTQTEASRRVLIALQGTNLNYPVPLRGFNAKLIAPYNATLANPGAVGFDIPNNYSLYQAGMNGNAQIGGTGGFQGLPPGGSFLSQVDGGTFQFGAYGATNALMLGNTYPTSGTLTFSNPASFNTLTILASSANGGGFGTCVLNYKNGTQSPAMTFNAQDWFNVTTNVALQGFGRLKLGQATFNTEDPGWNNPNLYHTTLNLASLGYNQAVGSITFTKPAIGGSQSTAIFAVSGSTMPPQTVITVQPQNTTNNNPVAGVTLNVVAMGAPPLAFQWYSGTPASSTLLPAQTGSSLTFSPALTNQAGNYFVIVTNSYNAVTSSVAALTIYGAPVITRQPTPTNLFLFAGQTARLSVAANAATPLAYVWTFNGSPIGGATTSAYTLGNVQSNNAGAYAVTLSNALGMITSAVVTMTIQAVPAYPYAQSVLADHPIGYWKLDETSGVVAHDYLGGNNGAYTNVALNQTGDALIDPHRAARFGSLASANSYVAGVPIDFATNGNAQFSVEAWVNASGQSSDSGIITKGAGGCGEQFNLDCGASGHGFRFFVREGASGTARSANGTVIPNSQWHHLVGVCDQVNGRVVLYIDGISNAMSTIVTNSGLLGTTNAVTFGSRKSGSASVYDLQFAGLMEEVAIYNYALTPARIQAHAASATNRAPVFTLNPFTEPMLNAGQPTGGTLATNASDPNGDAMTFAKISGPTWLIIAPGGALSGTPANVNAGTNTFVVGVRDASFASNTATMYLFVNGSPLFFSHPLNLAPVPAGQPITGTLADYSSDPNSDPITYSKLGGPSWLTVAANGALNGTPFSPDVGTNSFSVRATDPAGLFDTTTLNLPILAAPDISTTLFTSGTNLLLTWTGGIAPYDVQTTTNVDATGWSALASGINTNALGISATNTSSYFRVLGK